MACRFHYTYSLRARCIWRRALFAAVRGLSFLTGILRRSRGQTYGPMVHWGKPAAYIPKRYMPRKGEDAVAELKGKKLFLLDMDGTIYLDNDLFPGTIPFLSWVREVDFIATNPDWVCPTWYGAVPDCGSVCEMLYRATGRRPRVIGKPQRAMVDLALRRTGLPPEAALVVGDRLYTDIACGVNAGVDAAFVLSGEGTLADLETSDVKPTWVFDDIAALHRALREEENHGQHH